jgi:hypothetical protein
LEKRCEEVTRFRCLSGGCAGGAAVTARAATLKTLIFGLSSAAAIFFASAGYGLLAMLLAGTRSVASIGVAEFSTHGGLTLAFFVLAGVGAYVAKKCFW